MGLAVSRRGLYDIDRVLNRVGKIGPKFKSTFEVEKFSLKLERTIEVGNQFLNLKGHVH